MKLRRAFTSNTKLLVEAVKNNDVELLEHLQGKKETWFALYLIRLDFANITSPVADLLVNKMKADDWTRWGIKPEHQGLLLTHIFGQCLKAGRADLFDTFYNGIDWKNQEADGHPIRRTLASDALEPAVKASLVERLLAKGIEDVKEPAGWLTDALTSRSPAAFDILAKTLAIDIHRNNEELLRVAAKAEQKDMCRHLVEKHACDIDLAISTDRTIGNEKPWQFLDALRQEIKPDGKPVPTIESLSREIELLKETVRELTGCVRHLDGTAAPAITSPPAKTTYPQPPQ